jgi:hypothetical protein
LAVVGLVAAQAPAAFAASLSDADGDALPDEWETAPAGSKVPSTGRCTSKQRQVKGKCVPKKCKKGRKLKHGKCVKKKHRPRHKHTKARASAIAPANLASLGANPTHKDVFVQIDYANESIRQNLSCGDLDAIVAAFAKAPVSNPDGTTGVNLHIDAGVNCPGHNYNLGGSKIFNAGSCPTFGATMQALELPESRIGTFHITGFSPLCGEAGAAGVGDLGGARSMLFTDGSRFAQVLMHELGHNFGLDHPFGYQPNRLSVMNSVLAASDSGNGYEEVLDYQRISLPALDENNLSETAGISAPPEAHRFYIPHVCPESGGTRITRNAWPGDESIDWNCSSTGFPMDPPGIDPGSQALDVNGDGQLTVLPATGPEWPTLDYAGGGQIGPR